MTRHSAQRKLNFYSKTQQGAAFVVRYKKAQRIEFYIYKRKFNNN